MGKATWIHIILIGEKTFSMSHTANLSTETLLWFYLLVEHRFDIGHQLRHSNNVIHLNKRLLHKYKHQGLVKLRIQNILKIIQSKKKSGLRKICDRTILWGKVMSNTTQEDVWFINSIYIRTFCVHGIGKKPIVIIIYFK